MSKVRRYSPETRERAVRLVWDTEREYSSQWAAIVSISEKVGCTAETLRKWVRQAERDAGKRSGQTTGDRDRIKELEREDGDGLTRADAITGTPRPSSPIKYAVAS